MHLTAPPDTLEDWLASLLPADKRQGLLDIGAYRGDFSRVCLERGLATRAHLFEPNPANHPLLEDFCRTHPQVALHHLALGGQTGECDFFSSDDTATGSVLPYRGETQGSVKAFRVAQQTLDRWWHDHGEPRVGLIKVDTQGNDLTVLRNAADLLAAQRPWLVAELIFVSCYENQAKAGELISWLEHAGYSLAGIFNEHWSGSGMFAFADAAFVPAESAPPLVATFHARPTLRPLVQQVAELQRICDERLRLIEYLHAEAEKRLRLIEELSHALHGRKPV